MLKNNNNTIFDGDKGRLLLEISKTFHGDDRFKMDSRFKDDIDIDKLPQKFKQIAEKEIMDKIIAKVKPVKKKSFPLIINRFEPGTQAGAKLIRKAEGQKSLIEGLKKKQIKKNKKVSVKRGLNKIKLAERILKKQKKEPEKYEIVVKGDRKNAFQASSFRLFE